MYMPNFKKRYSLTIECCRATVRIFLCSKDPAGNFYVPNLTECFLILIVLSFPAVIMSVNRIIFEYPRGVEITVSFVDANGDQRMTTFGMVSPLLLRLGPGLEFESASSGNLLTLLGHSEPESDNTDSDSNRTEDDKKDDEDDTMDQDSFPEADHTIDLVSSDDEADTDADVSAEGDTIVVTHPTDA